MSARILHGNNLDILPTLPDASVDSIVTDPPYELGFMGKKWDASGIAYNVELWRECLRVLKPGGHLLAFSGSRTYHRMVVAIEDAGFEIRDQIMWVYGSGFPKSLDVSKAIDKQRHDRADILKVTNWIADCVKAANVSHASILAAFGFNTGSGMVGHWTARNIGSQPSVPTLDQVPLLLEVLRVNDADVPEDIRRLLYDLNGRKGQPGENFKRRKVIGTKMSGIRNPDDHERHTIGGSKAVQVDVTVAHTPEAQAWEGWGTALKPAHEPIVLARKPLIGTVAENVLRFGVGGLNIDATRIPFNEQMPRITGKAILGGTSDGYDGPWKNDPDAVARQERANAAIEKANTLGRWPANFIHDGTEEATQGLGSAARFFYCAKASKAERNAGLDQPSTHPTVKPLALMRYLIRLVTPPNGTVLDPFTGSGTTLVAATLEGCNSIGVEMTDEYLPIIHARIKWAEEQTDQPELPL